ncbi:MAG: exonuclease domain-containing protein [Flavobacteriales bacterium]
MSERQFIVYDLEATCWRSRKPRKVEIIEIGAVKMNERLEVVDDFCQFVRPKLHPEISPFCTKLTSIVQDDIEDAPLFDEAIEMFEDWVGFDQTRSMLMSWGEFDRRQFMNDARLHNMELPWLKYWACLQRHYSRWKGSKNQIGLKNAMEMEGLSFDGTQHRAIEDARNMGRLFAKVAKPLSIV